MKRREFITLLSGAVAAWPLVARAQQFRRIGVLVARDLVDRNVSVIVAAGGVASAPVAKAATATITIVFMTGADPIAAGLVTSLARPEANVTGVSFLTQLLGAKRLGFLNMLAPNASTVAVLVNPTNPGRTFVDKEIQDAGRASKRNIQVFEASTEAEIDPAFEAIIRQTSSAILVHTDPFSPEGTLQ